MAFISEAEKKAIADSLRSIAALAMEIRKAVYEPSKEEYRLQLSKGEAEAISLTSSRIYRDLTDLTRRMEGLQDTVKPVVVRDLDAAWEAVNAALMAANANKGLFSRIKGPQDEMVMRPLITNSAAINENLAIAKRNLEVVKRLEETR